MLFFSSNTISRTCSMMFNGFIVKHTNYSHTNYIKMVVFLGAQSGNHCTN